MTWINGYQKWLSESESLKNAQKVVDYLFTEDKDWSKESICALIGNMRHESSINPNMYEYGYSWGADRGFGLVQWTPRSKYWNWGSSKGYSESQLRNGDAQLARIDYEVDNNIQWIPRDSNFNRLTFEEFRTNSRGLTVNELTEAFTWGYERPNQQAGENSMPARKSFANRAFNELIWNGENPNPDPDPKPDPEDPEFDFDSIDKFFNDFGEIIIERIEKMLNVNLFDYGKSKNFGNEFLKVEKTFSNIYKMKPTLQFEDIINELMKEGNDLLNDILGGIIKPNPPDPDPDPNPVPDSEMYFPVNIKKQGVNFWKRSNWGVGTLQKNMTYGNRSSGEFHSGYDIGSGGNSGYKVYAIRDCIITDIRQVSGGGYAIFMKHTSDSYHSMYLHLQQDSAVVSIGDEVKAGQQVAIMGNTGGNYAIHLHVEISPSGNFHNEGNTIDPEGYLKITGDNQTSLPIPN